MCSLSLHHQISNHYLRPPYARRRAGVLGCVNQAEGARWFEDVRRLDVEAM